jgi:3-oxoacyl-[acyl-carrier protein] reductase
MSAFQTVFMGAVRFARALAAQLSEGGVIGFVLSSSVRVPIKGLGISNGLRPGLAGLAKDMSDELGPRGIRVLSLLPGSIYTDRTKEIHAATGDPEGARAAAEARIPLRRLAQPEEFGRVAAFTLSPAASYVTGIALPVDGGLIPCI